jgi:hypothetical protein
MRGNCCKEPREDTSEEIVCGDITDTSDVKNVFGSKRGSHDSWQYNNYYNKDYANINVCVLAYRKRANVKYNGV